MSGFPARVAATAALIALLLAVGALGASGASAAEQCSGSNVAGQGSSLQRLLQQQIWGPGFNTSADKKACSGTQGSKGKPTVGYNSTGSGAGLKSWGVETSKVEDTIAFGPGNAFIGTDEPPNASVISAIEAQEAVPTPNTLETIPVAQEALTIIVHLPSGCTATSTPAAGRLAIGAATLQGIFAGTVKTWGELTEGGNTITGTGCATKPIVPVVRQDRAGTTHILKRFLFLSNPEKLTTEGPSETWNELAEGAGSTLWPSAAAVQRPSEPGDVQEIAKVAAVPGSIGYATLADARQSAAFVPPTGGAGTGTFWTSLQSGTKGGKPTWEEPSTNGDIAISSNANCKKAAYENANGEVPFPPPDVYALWNEVNASGTVTNSYPLCGFTYVLAFNHYALLSNATEAEATTVGNYLSWATAKKEGQTLIGDKPAGSDYEALPTIVEKKATAGAKEVAFGTTPTRTLLGSEATSYSHEETSPTGFISAFQFVATQTGTLKELTIRSGATANTATSLVLGVAEEKEGLPATTPLGQGTVTGTPGTNALSTVTGLSIPVVAGKPYWLEVLNLGGSYHYKDADEPNSSNGGGLNYIESVKGGLTSLTNSEWQTFEVGFSAPFGPMCFYARGTGSAGTQKTHFGIAGNQDNGNAPVWTAGKVIGGSHGSLEIDYAASEAERAGLLTSVKHSLEQGVEPMITINTPDETRLTSALAPTYAKGAAEIVKQVMTADPSVKTFELINEPWFKGPHGSNASDYAAIVQATYEEAAAKGLTGATLLVGAFGDYELKDSEGNPTGKFSQAFGGAGWTADVLTSHPALKTMINGWESHPYGLPTENFQQSAGMLAVQSQRLMVIRHGGSGYNNWWITEVGFTTVEKGRPQSVENTTQQSEKLKADLEIAAEWSKEGWLTAIQPYHDDIFDTKEGYNLFAVPAQTMYTRLASEYGAGFGE